MMPISLLNNKINLKNNISFKHNAVEVHKSDAQIPYDNLKLTMNDNFSESIIRKYYNTGFFKGYYAMEGSVNDKVVNLRLDKGGPFNPYHYIGALGDDAVNITLNNKHALGKIGDKEIDLTYKTSHFSKKFSIIGKIGDKTINIANNSTIDSTMEEDDIVTLVTSLQGFHLDVKNRQFTKLSSSAQRQIDDMLLTTSGMNRQHTMNVAQQPTNLYL